MPMPDLQQYPWKFNLIWKIPSLKVLKQGKLFQRFTHFLYCSELSLGRKVNTRRMTQPDMESIFTKKIYEIFWSKETVMWIFEIIKIKCFYPPCILNEPWGIYSCLQIPPRDNWSQYVRRVYATAIKFPCIILVPCRRSSNSKSIFFYEFLHCFF